MKILIIGLPGSGKTTLAEKLTKLLKASWVNADSIREKYNDWDFSKEGVLRQAKRMGNLANGFKNKFVIADFICPYQSGRNFFAPDYLIWMDTIRKGRYPTFDKSFEKPKVYDLRITKKAYNVNSIVLNIKNKMTY